MKCSICNKTCTYDRKWYIIKNVFHNNIWLWKVEITRVLISKLYIFIYWTYQTYLNNRRWDCQRKKKYIPDKILVYSFHYQVFYKLKIAAANVPHIVITGTNYSKPKYNKVYIWSSYISCCIYKLERERVQKFLLLSR